MKIAEEFLHIAFFTTIIISAAFVVMQFRLVPDDGSTEEERSSLKQRDGVVEFETGLIDPCALKDVYCSWKRLMRVTEYGWTGSRMANMEWPYEGAVATSDRTIPFGTKLLINGVEYTVADRTANWLEDKFEYSTIDIFSKNPKGLRYEEVIFKQ